MIKIRYLFRNFNLLNLLLIAAVAAIAHYSVLPLLNINPNFKYPVSSPKKTLAEKAPEPEPLIPSPSDYLIISEENLFHPDRKIPAEKKEEAPLPKPEFVLYGTLITDTTSVAYLEDLKAPRNSPGRGKRQNALKIGDALSGFTLQEIAHDRIVMTRGEEKMVVPVLDAERPKSRSAAAAVSKGPAGPAPGSPVPPRARSSRVRSPRPGGSFINRESPRTPQTPKTRAPMTPADEKARQFFTK